MTAASLRNSAMFRALAARATERHRRSGRFEAEYVPGCTPAWHVVRTEPSRENTAAAYLVGRRFGVYIPELSAKVVHRGRLVIRREPMFPGYILMFVWDIELHRRRIEACPGVTRVLRYPSGRAVRLSDAEVRDIQAQEERSALSTLRWPKASRRYRRSPQAPSLHDQDIVSVSCRSYWENVGSLDSDGRNTILRKALGLC